MWLAALSASVVCASSAHAYSVTLGPSKIPSAPPTEGHVCQAFCEEPFTLAQRASPYLNVAPASGVVTSWRVNAEDGPLTLRVLEPSSGGGWVGEGTSAAATDLAGGPNATEMEIRQGDLIGVDLGFGAFIGAELSAPSGDEELFWRPALSEGAGSPPHSTIDKDLLWLSAEVELTPVVTSVSPASGTTAGGDTVTITGKYLDSALNVVFGSRPATTFSVDLSGERITARTPASTAGTIDVHVSNRHSSSDTVAADRYTFVAGSTPPAAPPPTSGGPGQAGIPVVTGFNESSSKWRLGNSLPHISSAPVGTSFTFRLNEPASVALTFVRVASGRRAGGKCVAPSHTNRSKPKCKRNVLAGSLAVSGHAGLNRVRFQGRVSPAKRLTPGSYSASVTARDAHGLKTLTRSLSFTIVP